MAAGLVLAACGAGREAEAEALAEDFLADLRAGAWQAAFGRMHGDFQAACGSASGLEQRVQAAAVQPKGWSFSSVSAFKHTGYVEFTLVAGDGGTRHANLDLERVGGELRVLNWRVEATDLCGEV
ncbi:hypothetical protein [Wenzhouxiangella marina]|nr:hypothetical protein [Wenzhouxiangella marina]MBB6087169.1 hypothetical protein [Wenzhouxiangella marina]